jgi:hypothetical protein
MSLESADNLGRNHPNIREEMKMAENSPELLWKFHEGEEPYWQTQAEYYGRRLVYQIGLRGGRWVLCFGVDSATDGVPGADWDKGDVVAAFKAAGVHLGNILADPSFQTEPGSLPD